MSKSRGSTLPSCRSTSLSKSTPTDQPSASCCSTVLQPPRRRRPSVQRHTDNHQRPVATSTRRDDPISPRVRAVFPRDPAVGRHHDLANLSTKNPRKDPHNAKRQPAATREHASSGRRATAGSVRDAGSTTSGREVARNAGPLRCHAGNTRGGNAHGETSAVFRTKPPPTAHQGPPTASNATTTNNEAMGEERGETTTTTPGANASDGTGREGVSAATAAHSHTIGRDQGI